MPFWRSKPPMLSGASRHRQQQDSLLPDFGEGTEFGAEDYQHKTSLAERSSSPSACCIQFFRYRIMQSCGAVREYTGITDGQ